MQPRMRNRSAGQPVAKSRGGRTSVWVRRGGRGRGPKGEPLTRHSSLVGNQGNVESQNGNVVNEIVQENVRNVLVNSNQVGCSYRKFLACNPKEYDCKGGAIVLTRCIKEIEFVQDMSGKRSAIVLTACSFVGKALMKIERYVYGLAPQIHGMVAATEPKTMHKAVQSSGALTNEAVRNGSIKKVEKRGNVGEPSKDKNGRDDNKRTRTENAFTTIANPVRRENTGAWPKCTTYNSYHSPKGPCRTCFNCNRPGYFVKDCRVVPWNVNLINVRNPTPTRGTCYECGSIDHLKTACPRLNRAQGPGGNCLNQVVANNGGMDWLSNHKAEITCHEKVVRVPLLDGKVLRVLGEKPKEKARLLVSVKAIDEKQVEIVVVRDFPELIHILKEPSFFFTKNTSAPQGDELSRMKPLSWSSLSCPDNSSNSEGAKR
nr:hypothetical protein [Tanacetum cinerariifolium]